MWFIARRKLHAFSPLIVEVFAGPTLLHKAGHYCTAVSLRTTFCTVQSLNDSYCKLYDRLERSLSIRLLLGDVAGQRTSIFAYFKYVLGWCDPSSKVRHYMPLLYQIFLKRFHSPLFCNINFIKTWKSYFCCKETILREDVDVEVREQ